MTSISLPASLTPQTSLRALNVLKDLPRVADLIEVCFSGTMDREGRRYIREMRQAGQQTVVQRWATRLGEGTALPLTGYVWDEGGRIVGNTSLIPFRHSEQRIYLIANVAVHPDFRGRGIARALTERAMQHARQKMADAVWLSVRADNESALGLYASLGFIEQARRTSWDAGSDQPPSSPAKDFEIGPRRRGDWPLQRQWLDAAYPAQLSWHRRWDFSALRPGVAAWLYGWLMDLGLRQWTARRGGNLEGVLSYLPTGHDAVLFAGLAPHASSAALTALLLTARESLPPRPTLSLEFPAGTHDAAIAAAGFRPQRTLVWMRAAT